MRVLFSLRIFLAIIFLVIFFAQELRATIPSKYLEPRKDSKIEMCRLLFERFRIEVFYDTFDVRVYGISESGYEKEILSTRATLARKSFRLPQLAYVKNVLLDPWWYPSNGVMRRYAKKNEKKGLVLKKAYPPGDPMNAMGSFKLILDFKNLPGYYMGDNQTRLHEERSPRKIGTRDSSGCVRLRKKDGIFLSKLLWGLEPSKRIVVYTTKEIAEKNRHKLF